MRRCVIAILTSAHERGGLAHFHDRRERRALVSLIRDGIAVIVSRDADGGVWARFA